jgi:FkbM family methyltransferase
MIPQIHSDMRVQSYSQHCEDIYVHRNFMNVKRDDISIAEVGAFDGITYTNSLLFEKELGSQPAILVEPSPHNAVNASKNRQDSCVYQVACAEYFGVSSFSGDEAISGITDMFTPEYSKKWKTDRLTSYNVITVPMQAIIDVIPTPYLDLLSLDVQGAELSCLKSLNFLKPIGCIVIELEGHKPDEDELCRSILKARSYRFAARLHRSEVWILSDYSRHALLYDSGCITNLTDYQVMPYSKRHFKNLKELL